MAAPNASFLPVDGTALRFHYYLRLRFEPRPPPPPSGRLRRPLSASWREGRAPCWQGRLRGRAPLLRWRRRRLDPAARSGARNNPAWAVHCLVRSGSSSLHVPGKVPGAPHAAPHAARSVMWCALGVGRARAALRDPQGKPARQRAPPLARHSRTTPRNPRQLAAAVPRRGACWLLCMLPAACLLCLPSALPLALLRLNIDETEQYVYKSDPKTGKIRRFFGSYATITRVHTTPSAEPQHSVHSRPARN